MTLGRTKQAKSRKVEIAFHSDNVTGCDAHPAINVKVYSLPHVDAAEDILARAYDQTVEDFWECANWIAQAHGYSGVFSEGRSDGWLVPYTQHDRNGKLVTQWTGQGPDKGYPTYPDMEDKAARREFLLFRTDIEELLREAIEKYCARVQELSDDDEPNPDDK